MLTKNDLLKIEQYFKKATKKDTDFASIDKEHIDATTKLPVIHNNENKIINLQDFFSSEVSRNLITEVLAMLEEKKNELDSLINQAKKTILNISEKTGVSPYLGTSDSVGVSQNTLSRIVNNIYTILSSTGEVDYTDFTITASKNYFVSNNPVEIIITAQSYASAVGPFDWVEFYINTDEPKNLIAPRTEGASFIQETVTISNTTKIICKVQILGQEKTKELTIHHYNAFWVGAGNVYTDVLDVNYAKDLSNGMKMEVDGVVFAGNVDPNEIKRYLFIVMGKSVSSDFVRADINGIEIPLEKSTIKQSSVETYGIDEDLIVYKSINQFDTGTYNNININS